MTLLEFASIGGGLAAVATFFIIFWKVAVFFGEWKEKEKVINRIESDLSDMKESIFEIKASIQVLSRKEGGGAEMSDSPARLTKIGEDIAEKISAEKIISDKLETLSGSFVGLETNLDIEEKSREISREIYEQLDKETKKVAKDALYEHGLPLIEIYSVFAIILRDRIIQERENKTHEG